MELDFDACYEAIKSRDARFDGRFFTGVSTTGIYCRPICPARTPGRGNVRFYPFAAAAEEAGFRPCRRCRPDRSPDSPDWNWRGDLVGRALRLIGDGVADSDGIPGVADRLAVSERHLRRLFVSELGASPGTVARTHRTQLARRLIEESSLSLSDVAMASGFSSIRRFNSTIQETFGHTPGALRRAARPSAVPGCTLHLPYRAPLAGAALFHYLAGRATPGVEEVEGTRYRRTIYSDGAKGTVELELTPLGDIRMTARLDRIDALAGIVRRARNLLDLDADPDAIASHLSSDPKLRSVVARVPGLRVPGSFDGFELAVRAILGQQVSVKSATTLAGRLAAAFGEPLDEPDGGLTHVFPTPERLVDAPIASIGLPSRRAATINTLARSVTSGDIVLDGTADLETTKARLLALPGFGPWTVSYIAMRALRDPDSFLPSDLGIKHALTGLDIDP
ncbi:MAG: AraC family transcriptional regulator, partial [Actinomycetota bacterium]|nr:AraC family transcriptional regulator [Actinomycetota bacterium]